MSIGRDQVGNDSANELEELVAVGFRNDVTIVSRSRRMSIINKI